MMKLVNMNSLGLFGSSSILSVQIGFALLLTAGLFCFLATNAVTFRRDKSIFFSRSLIFIVVIIFNLLFNDFSSNIYKGLGLLGGFYHSTLITQTFHSFLSILSICIIVITAFYPRKVWHKDFSLILYLFSYKLIHTTIRLLNKTAKHFRILEYPLLILFTITGGFFLINSNDLVSVFLSIEFQSYGLYIISALYRNSELSTMGGLIYFLLGSLSSCLILFGSSILYIGYGSTYFEVLYIISNISYKYYKYLESKLLYLYKYYNIQSSLLIISVGLLFKVSAAPFHFWSPDVYDSIPTIITTFVAIIGKIPIFIILLELVHFTSKSIKNFFFVSWKTSLVVSSLLSLIIGTIGGLTQLRIKRLYAYSTISHVGFILLALSINSIESIQSFFFYIIQYSISNLNAFIILLSIGFSLYFVIENEKNSILVNNNKKYIEEKNNSPLQFINQIKGYFYVNPVLALSFAITFFSFAGVPPLLGFFGKQMVLSAALDKGYFFLALIAILTSVISAVYYLALIKQMVFY